MQTGYAISDQDYQRVKDAIRKIEGLAAVNYFRRFPVINGGGDGFPAPSERMGIFDTNLTLVKGTHDKRILYIDLTGAAPRTDNCTITTAVNPSVGDTFFLHCSKSGVYYARLCPNTGQTIICPSRSIVYGDGYWLNLGTVGTGTGIIHQVILVCCAANTWITWATSSSDATNSGW